MRPFPRPSVLCTVAGALLCRWLTASVALAGISATVPSSVQQESPGATTSPEELHRLVLQLADEDFVRRDRATRELLRIGAASLPVLEEYREATDNELRLAALRLISRIRSRSQEQAVALFLDGQGSLPGWERFRRRVADSRQGRQAFADLYRNRATELTRLEDESLDRVTMLEDWLNEWSFSLDRQVQLDKSLWALVSVLTADLFADNDSTDTVPPRLQLRLGQAMLHPGMRQLLEDPEMGDLYRAAIVAWISNRETSPLVVPVKISVAAGLRLREGLEAAVRCLEMPDIPGSHRRAAMVLIAQLGNAEHVPLLEQHLANTLVVHRGSRRGLDGNLQKYTVQLGDVALASLVFLTGQGYADYGFDSGRVNSKSGLLPWNMAGFSSDEDRQAARRRWTEFRHPESPASPQPEDPDIRPPHDPSRPQGPSLHG